MTTDVELSPHTGTRGENGADPARRIIVRTEAIQTPRATGAGLETGLMSLKEVRLGATDSTASQDPDRLGGSPHLSVALIATFAPEPYEVKKPLPISIYLSDDGYSASFFDANIHTTGDNEQEAFENIKSLILDMFDSVRSRKVEELGPGPRHQLRVLEKFISRAL